MKSLLKWAGAKNWLVERYAHLLPDPSTITAYREPFVGSGAVAKHYLGRVPCHLSDANARLITMYRGVRDAPDAVIEELRSLKYDKQSFEHYRGLFNVAEVRDHDRAAWFIYLNHCGFNGLYRENSKGQFNVPFGRYTNPKFCDEETIRSWSKLLQDATLTHQDYTEALAEAREGEFVFLDPPYVPASATANFTGYVAGGFRSADQERLGAALARLDERGVRWMLTNSTEARGLYSRWNVLEVDVKRSISCKQRGKAGEIIVANYPLATVSEAA